MKSRSGFVSNSSTTAFVFLGFDYSKEFEAIEDKDGFLEELEDAGREFLSAGDTPEGVSLVVGEELTAWSDDDYPQNVVLHGAVGIEGRVEALKQRLGASEEIQWWEGTYGY